MKRMALFIILFLVATIANCGVISEVFEKGGKIFLRQMEKSGVRETSKEFLKSGFKGGKEVLEKTKPHVDDFWKVTSKYGRKFSGSLVKQAEKRFPGLVEGIFNDYGREGLEVISKYGDDALKCVKKYGDDVIRFLKKYPKEAKQILKYIEKNGYRGIAKLDREGLRALGKGMEKMSQKSLSSSVVKSTKRVLKKIFDFTMAHPVATLGVVYFTYKSYYFAAKIVGVIYSFLKETKSNVEKIKEGFGHSFFAGIKEIFKFIWFVFTSIFKYFGIIYYLIAFSFSVGIVYFILTCIFSPFQCVGRIKRAVDFVWKFFASLINKISKLATKETDNLH